MATILTTEEQESSTLLKDTRKMFRNSEFQFIIFKFYVPLL